MIGALTRQKLYSIDNNNIELQSNKEKLYRNGEREKDNSSGGEGFPPFQSNVLLSNV